MLHIIANQTTYLRPHAESAGKSDFPFYSIFFVFTWTIMYYGVFIHP